MIHAKNRDMYGCMEDDSTGMVASPTATADVIEEEEEEISDRGFHSAPSISKHSQLLLYQQPLESVHLLTAQCEEDNEISSRQSLQGSFQLNAVTSASWCQGSITISQAHAKLTVTMPPTLVAARIHSTSGDLLCLVQ
ncbi:hypothetical protein WJX77_002885 [Trebouxia sp. C0004]